MAEARRVVADAPALVAVDTFPEALAAISVDVSATTVVVEPALVVGVLLTLAVEASITAVIASTVATSVVSAMVVATAEALVLMLGARVPGAAVVAVVEVTAAWVTSSEPPPPPQPVMAAVPSVKTRLVIMRLRE
jgi:hypothetical protein